MLYHSGISPFCVKISKKTKKYKKTKKISKFLLVKIIKCDRIGVMLWY